MFLRSRNLAGSLTSAFREPARFPCYNIVPVDDLEKMEKKRRAKNGAL